MKMTAKERLARARAANEAAIREVYAAELAVEEAEGRPDSHAARFARAVLEDRLMDMERLALESEVEYRQQYPDRHAAQEARVADEIERRERGTK